MSEPQLPRDIPQIPEDFARTDDEAKERHDRWAGCDPFPLIPAALLNSADVYDYVRATGMIHPFDVTRLKSASYKVSIGYIYIFWDGKGKKHIKQLAKNGEFELEPNSIGFVQTKEIFRLPHYIERALIFESQMYIAGFY